MVQNENFVHVKLEIDEALEAKRSMLASQIALLRILKTTKNYRLLRVNEFQLKQDLLTKMRGLRMKISNIEKTLPRLKIPEIVKNSNNSGVSSNHRVNASSGKAKSTSIKDISVEDQLYEIQRRLNELQERNI